MQVNFWERCRLRGGATRSCRLISSGNNMKTAALTVVVLLAATAAEAATIIMTGTDSIDPRAVVSSNVADGLVPIDDLLKSELAELVPASQDRSRLNTATDLRVIDLPELLRSLDSAVSGPRRSTGFDTSGEVFDLRSRRHNQQAETQQRIGYSLSLPGLQ